MQLFFAEVHQADARLYRGQPRVVEGGYTTRSIRSLLKYMLVHSELTSNKPHEKTTLLTDRDRI